MSKYDIFKNRLFVEGEIGDGSPYYPLSYNTKITQQDWTNIQARHADFTAHSDSEFESYEASLDEAQTSKAAASEAKEIATSEKAAAETSKTDTETSKADKETKKVAATEAKGEAMAEQVASQDLISAEKNNIASLEQQLTNDELSDADRQALQTQLTTANTALASYEEDFAEAQTDEAAKTAEIAQLTKDIEDLTAVIAEKTAIIAEKTDFIAEQEAIIAEKTDMITKINDEKAALEASREKANSQYDSLSTKINDGELVIVAPADQPLVRIIDLSQMQEVKRKLEQLKKDKIKAEDSETKILQVIKDAQAAGEPTEELERQLEDTRATIEELGDAIPFIENQIKTMESTDPIGTRPVDEDGYTYSVDTDGDGSPDFADNDIDGDNVPNVDDAFPYNSNESVDTDGDGIGNNADLDADGDGISNANEITLGSDPLDPEDTPELTTLMRLGQEVGAYLTQDFKEVKEESDDHFTSLNAELVAKANEKLAEVKEEIQRIKTSQAEESEELGTNNVAAMFSVFDGVYERGKGEESLPAAIRNLGLTEDQQEQLMELIVTLSDTQKTDHEAFATELSDFLVLVGTLTQDEKAAANYSEQHANKLNELSVKAIDSSKNAKESTLQHLENTTKTLQKVIDVRAMETKDGVYWYSNMEDGSSRVLTNELYQQAKMDLKAEVDKENIPLDQWAIESSKLLLRHVGKNSEDDNIHNDQNRRNNIYQSINFFGIDTKALKVEGVTKELLNLEKRAKAAKADNSADLANYTTTFDKLQKSGEALIAQFEADKTEYEQEKDEAEAILSAREADKAAAYDAYKAETVEEEIPTKFQLYLDAHAKAMEARIALSKLNYMFAAVSLIFQRESQRIQRAIPTLQDAITQSKSTEAMLDSIIVSVASELASTIADADPVTGKVGRILDVLEKMDDDWTTGNGFRDDDAWTTGDREYNANYSFARNEAGELINPNHIEKVKQAYTGHNAA